MTSGIEYGQLMHKAMQRVLYDVLSIVAENGLPGDHHFFITFDTTHPGVDMDDGLRQRFPEEMTIVMQEWFADLAVMPDRFTVTLNFGNQPEPLVVPFDAIKTFVDPSVEFGLRFDGQEAEPEDGDADEEAGQDAETPEPEDETAAVADESEAEVVSLDKFRK
ncbi:MAG: SspB family protein [Paracoccaceae bacterium]